MPHIPGIPKTTHPAETQNVSLKTEEKETLNTLPFVKVSNSTASPETIQAFDISKFSCAHKVPLTQGQKHKREPKENRDIVFNDAKKHMASYYFFESSYKNDLKRKINEQTQIYHEGLTLAGCNKKEIDRLMKPFKNENFLNEYINQAYKEYHSPVKKTDPHNEPNLHDLHATKEDIHANATRHQTNAPVTVSPRESKKVNKTKVLFDLLRLTPTQDSPWNVSTPPENASSSERGVNQTQSALSKEDVTLGAIRKRRDTETEVKNPSSSSAPSASSASSPLHPLRHEKHRQKERQEKAQREGKEYFTPEEEEKLLLLTLLQLYESSKKALPNADESNPDDETKSRNKRFVVFPSLSKRFTKDPPPKTVEDLKNYLSTLSSKEHRGEERDEVLMRTAELLSIKFLSEGMTMEELEEIFIEQHINVTAEIEAANERMQKRQVISLRERTRATSEHEDCRDLPLHNIRSITDHIGCLLESGILKDDLKIAENKYSALSIDIAMLLKGLNPKDSENIKNMAHSFSAVSVLNNFNPPGAKQNQKETTKTHQHPLHTQELLRYILDLPVHEDSHHDLGDLCGLPELLNPIEQGANILETFLDDINNLIKDKEMTEVMKRKFQEEYLESARENLSPSWTESFQAGFSATWEGGPTQAALLLKAAEDINSGKRAISWSPETIHALTMASHTWAITTRVLIPEMVAIDSLISLGKSVMESRAEFCDYVRSAAVIGLSVGPKALAENPNTSLGRIHSIDQIRENIKAFHEQRSRERPLNPLLPVEPVTSTDSFLSSLERINDKINALEEASREQAKPDTNSPHTKVKFTQTDGLHVEKIINGRLQKVKLIKEHASNTYTLSSDDPLLPKNHHPYYINEQGHLESASLRGGAPKRPREEANQNPAGQGTSEHTGGIPPDTEEAQPSSSKKSKANRPSVKDKTSSGAKERASSVIDKEKLDKIKELEHKITPSNLPPEKKYLLLSLKSVWLECHRFKLELETRYMKIGKLLNESPINEEMIKKEADEIEKTTVKINTENRTGRETEKKLSEFDATKSNTEIDRNLFDSIKNKIAISRRKIKENKKILVSKETKMKSEDLFSSAEGRDISSEEIETYIKDAKKQTLESIQTAEEEIHVEEEKTEKSPDPALSFVEIDIDITSTEEFVLTKAYEEATENLQDNQLKLLHSKGYSASLARLISQKELKLDYDAIIKMKEEISKEQVQSSQQSIRKQHKMKKNNYSSKLRTLKNKMNAEEEAKKSIRNKAIPVKAQRMTEKELLRNLKEEKTKQDDLMKICEARNKESTSPGSNEFASQVLGLKQNLDISQFLDGRKFTYSAADLKVLDESKEPQIPETHDVPQVRESPPETALKIPQNITDWKTGFLQKEAPPGLKRVYARGYLYSLKIEHGKMKIKNSMFQLSKAYREGETSDSINIQSIKHEIENKIRQYLANKEKINREEIYLRQEHPFDSNPTNTDALNNEIRAIENTIQQTSNKIETFENLEDLKLFDSAFDLVLEKIEASTPINNVLNEYYSNVEREMKDLPSSDLAISDVLSKNAGYLSLLSSAHEILAENMDDLYKIKKVKVEIKEEPEIETQEDTMNHPLEDPAQQAEQFNIKEEEEESTIDNVPGEGITELDKKINARFTKTIENLSTLESQFNNQITELKEEINRLQNPDDIISVNTKLEELISERQKIIDRRTHIQSVLDGTHLHYS